MARPPAPPPARKQRAPLQVVQSFNSKLPRWPSASKFFGAAASALSKAANASASRLSVAERDAEIGQHLRHAGLSFSAASIRVQAAPALPLCSLMRPARCSASK